MKVGQSISFSTVLEDNLDAKFETITGNVRLEKPDSFAEKTKTKKVTLNYIGQKSTWWVDDRGAATLTELEMPGGQKAIIKKASEAEAKAFLD
jgi:hypothetical protein